MNEDSDVKDNGGLSAGAEPARPKPNEETTLAGPDRAPTDPFIDALDQRTVRRRLEAAERRIERLQHELAQLADWRERSRRGVRQRLWSSLLGALPGWIALAIASAAATIIWQDHRQLADLVLQIPVPGSQAPTDVAGQPAQSAEQAPGSGQEPPKPLVTQPSRQALPTLRHPAGPQTPAAPRG